MDRFILPPLFVLVFMVLFMECKQTYPIGGPYYYKSWNSYQVPFEPVGAISIETAKQLESYYEAFFNNDGKILRFTKYFHGQVEFSATYSYRKDGTLESGELFKKNGEKTVQNFDKNGNLEEK